MSARADLLTSAKQYPRHCFANISVDHHEFGRWQYRNELRCKDASPLLPVVDADVVPERLGARVRNKECRETSKLLRKILRHVFPALFVGADARGNSGKNLSQVASGIASHPAKYGDPVLEQFATGARA